MTSSWSSIFLTGNFLSVTVDRVMKRFLVILTIFTISCLGFVGALSVVPHGHGDDLDHSSHTPCPVHQLRAHFSADISSSFPVITALLLFVFLVTASKDVRIRAFHSSALLRAPPQAS